MHQQIIKANNKDLFGILDSFFDPRNSLIPFNMNDRIFGKMNNTVSQIYKMRILEDADKYYLSMLVPGISKDNIDINLENNNFTIKVSQSNELSEESDNKKILFNEVESVNVSRSYYFKNKVDENSVNAKLENGVLFVEINKIKEEKKKIKIN